MFYYSSTAVRALRFFFQILFSLYHAQFVRFCGLMKKKSIHFIFNNLVTRNQKILLPPFNGIQSNGMVFIPRIQMLSSKLDSNGEWISYSQIAFGLCRLLKIRCLANYYNKQNKNDSRHKQHQCGVRSWYDCVCVLAIACIANRIVESTNAIHTYIYIQIHIHIHRLIRTMSKLAKILTFQKRSGKCEYDLYIDEIERRKTVEECEWINPN